MTQNYGRRFMVNLKSSSIRKEFIFVIFVIFTLLNPFYEESFGEDFQGLSTGDGIKLIRSPHFELNSFRLALIVDREINLIQIDFSPFSFNKTKSGNIALVLPYQGTLQENTGWEIKNFERNTVLMKKYTCSEDVPCYAFPREFVIFAVDGKLDNKIDTHHVVSFQIRKPLIKYL